VLLIWPLDLFLKVQKANLRPFFWLVTDRQTLRGIEAPSRSLKINLNRAGAAEPRLKTWDKLKKLV
jgi:hypothetical protein